MRVRNNIISHYHYRVYPKLEKGVCAIRQIPCESQDYVYQFDKEWLTNCFPSTQPGYACVENYYYLKIVHLQRLDNHGFLGQ